MIERLWGLWQLPQNLLGWVVSRFGYLATREEKADVYVCGWLPAGVSLGKYILLSGYDRRVVRHEWGHCRQSRFLGWLYLPLIGLPSILHNIVWRACGKRWSYYGFPTERWADLLGGVRR